MNRYLDALVWLHQLPDAYLKFLLIFSIILNIHMAQSAGAAEYTDCISAEEWNLSHPNEYPGYDTRQSDGEVSVMLDVWGMRSTPSLKSLPAPLWPEVEVPNRIFSMGQIELLIFKLSTYAKLNCFK